MKTIEIEQRIVSLQRGNIVVGDYHVDVETDEIVVQNASVIRRWGTTKGLGELRNGPLPDTILDYAGEVRAPRGSVVFTIKVNPGAEWPTG